MGNTIQPNRSADAARLAAELAARQAEEAAKREAQRAMERASSTKPRTTDGFDRKPQRFGPNLTGETRTPVPVATPAPTGTSRATPPAGTREMGTPTPVGPTTAVGSTTGTGRVTISSEAELVAYLAKQPPPPAPFDLSNVDFTFQVDLGPGSTLSNLLAAQFPGQRVDTLLQGANFSGAHFQEGIANTHLIGSNLTDARIDGTVENVSFLYANLTNADFSGCRAVHNGDFAFSNITDMDLPASVDTTGSVFTGTARAAEPVLDGSVRLNDPALLSSLTGTSDPAAQAALIRGWEADGTLFDRLAATLPAGTLDGQLSREWRSRLYDELNTTPGMPTTADAAHWTLKAHIFDAVDGRYGAYDRPDGGPSLRYLYELDTGGTRHLQSAINGALADMLLSDTPVALDAPYGGNAPPFASYDLARLAGQAESGALTGAGSTLDNWLGATFIYNGLEFSVANTNLDAAAIDAARTWLQANRPDLVDTFNAMASDGLLSPQHLLDAGMRDVVQHLFDSHYTP